MSNICNLEIIFGIYLTFFCLKNEKRKKVIEKNNFFWTIPEIYARIRMKCGLLRACMRYKSLMRKFLSRKESRKTISRLKGVLT